MNYKMIVEGAKVAQKELKSQFAGQVSESRFLVQFQSGEVYQYRANVDGLAKLMKVNFDEVIMVQFAVGNSSKRGRYSKFYPVAVKMLAFKEVFIVPQKEEEEEVPVGDEEFSWN